MDFALGRFVASSPFVFYMQPVPVALVNPGPAGHVGHCPAQPEILASACRNAGRDCDTGHRFPGGSVGAGGSGSGGDCGVNALSQGTAPFPFAENVYDCRCI